MTRNSTQRDFTQGDLLKADALIPLHIAVRICYAALYADRVPDAPAFDAQLTRLAETMTARVPLYVRKSMESLGRRLARSEWGGGTVHKGGRELRFPDGRAPLCDLHVPRNGVDEVIRALRPAD